MPKSDVFDERDAFVWSVHGHEIVGFHVPCDTTMYSEYFTDFSHRHQETSSMTITGPIQTKDQEDVSFFVDNIVFPNNMPGWCSMCSTCVDDNKVVPKGFAGWILANVSDSIFV